MKWLQKPFHTKMSSHHTSNPDFKRRQVSIQNNSMSRFPCSSRCLDCRWSWSSRLRCWLSAYLIADESHSDCSILKSSSSNGLNCQEMKKLCNFKLGSKKTPEKVCYWPIAGINYQIWPSSTPSWANDHHLSHPPSTSRIERLFEDPTNAPYRRWHG